MIICDRCSTSIPDGARFCPACGDPVTAADLPGNRAGPGSETVQLVCPHCERQSLFTIPSHGAGSLTCSACAKPFDTSVVRIRSKRSAGQKKLNTRTFSVRVEGLDGREDFIEFTRPSNEDFELRSRDLAAFSAVQGRLAIVQNMSVGRYMKLTGPGCTGSILLWLCAAATMSAFVF
jgi:hypothetical protein